VNVHRNLVKEGLSKFKVRESTDFDAEHRAITFLEFRATGRRGTMARMNAKTFPAWLPCRTYLFVPGDRPERFDKAWNSSADAVILDLEDAVLPERKALARDAVSQWLRPGRPVWLRCNAVDSAWFSADTELASHPGVAGFIVPKAEALPDPLLAEASSRRIGLIALIETAQGIENAIALAREPGVVRLAFGALDFQVDIGIEDDDQALLYFRSRLVLASRLGDKLAPIDGVTPSIHDPAVIRNDTLRARRLGFGARLCIHPSQVDVVHDVLSPSDESRRWAERVVSAMASSVGGAVVVDGKMVDRPVVLRAQSILASPPAHQRLRGSG